MRRVYWSLTDLVREALRFIHEDKQEFVKFFIRPKQFDYTVDDPEHSAETIITNHLTPEQLKKFYSIDPDYFYEFVKFNDELLMHYFNNRSINNKLYNQILSLAAFLPDLCDFLRKNKSDIPEYTISKSFLKYAIGAQVPPRYYFFLSVILMSEHAKVTRATLKNDSMRLQLHKEEEAMTELYHKAFDTLMPIFRLSKQDFYLKAEDVKPSHVFVYQGKPYPLTLFDGHRGRKFIILGDSGTGKTMGLMRAVYAAEKKGFTVILFGSDKDRMEWRFASHKLKVKADRNMYEFLRRQGETPEALPIKIYTDKPIYKCERDVAEWDGSKTDWKKAKGILFFESDIIRVMDSFSEYRSHDKKKNFMAAFNEIQEIANSLPEKGKTELYKRVGKSFTHWSGNAVPTIINTHFSTGVKKRVRMGNEWFLSFMSSFQSRKDVAQDLGNKDFRNYLARQWLAEKHVFYRVYQNKLSSVRFLVPPCMPENKYYPLDKILKKL